jgi:hypothetical protein
MTATVTANSVIPISQARGRAANKFVARIVFGYRRGVGQRLDKPYVLTGGFQPSAREVVILAAAIVSLCIVAAIELL